MTIPSDGPDGLRASRGSHLLGIAYVVLLLGATAGGLFVSFRLVSRWGCMTAVELLPIILASLGAAAVPLLSLMPSLRERISIPYRIGATIVPLVILILYGTMILLGSAMGAAGPSSGSWTTLLMPVIDLAPLLSLSFASVVAAVASRRTRSLVINIVVFLGVQATSVITVALLRETYWC